MYSQNMYVKIKCPLSGQGGHPLNKVVYGSFVLVPVNKNRVLDQASLLSLGSGDVFRKEIQYFWFPSTIYQNKKSTCYY